MNGGTGTGKSFAIHILAAKLADHTRDLTILTPTQTTAWSWTEAVAKMRRIGAGDPGLRTDIGGVKFEDVAPIIAGLREQGGIDRSADGDPLFVAIDFEDAKELGSQGPPWREFIKQLAGQPWIRLLIIGLSEGERQTLDSILENERSTESIFPFQINLQHADSEELKQFLQALYRDRGQTPTKAAIDQKLNAWSAGASLHSARAELQTAEAVLFALTIYKADLSIADGGG